MYRSDLLKRYIGIKTDLMTPQSNLAEMSLYVTLLICQFTLDYIESHRKATLKMMSLN